MAGRKKAEEAAPEKTAGIEENFARLEEIIKKTGNRGKFTGRDLCRV